MYIQCVFKAINALSSEQTKKLRDSWICFDQTSLGLGLGKLFPARESLVSDIPAGDENTAKPFFTVYVLRNTALFMRMFLLLSTYWLYQYMNRNPFCVFFYSGVCRQGSILAVLANVTCQAFSCHPLSCLGMPTHSWPCLNPVPPSKFNWLK